MKNRLQLVRFISICFLLLSSQPVWSSECVDVTLGSVQLSIPKQYLMPGRSTPYKDNSSNFIFAFDSSMPGVDCPLACKELFVNVSSTSPTPEQNWVYIKPKLSGRTDDNYTVYEDPLFSGSNKPLWEILVPLNISRPQDEFYVCNRESQKQNITPLCQIKVVAKSGLIAEFSIPRKVLSRARDAAKFVTQSIDQFSENHSKGICK